MEVEIKNYELKESSKENIMIAFKKRTLNIDKITLCTYYYSIEKKALILEYYIGENKSFSYILSNIPYRFKRKLNEKDIILISEEVEQEDIIIVDQEEGFHYDCINIKKLKI